MATQAESRALIPLVQSCASVRSLKPLHAAALRRRPSDLSLLSAAAAAASRYAALGRPDLALSLALSLSAPPPSPSSSDDPFPWNLLLRALSDSGAHRRALSLYRLMPRPLPDRFTFPPLLKSCARLRDLAEGAALHRHAAALGLHADAFVANSLVAMYGCCGDAGAAREVFDGMRERNVVSWTAMIGALAQNGFRSEALGMFRKVLGERGVRPNRATFLNAMPCVTAGEDADELYRLIVRQGLDSDLSVRNAMVGMFARCRRIELARKVFDGISDKDLLSWTSMIEAYGQADMYVDALNLFKKMKQLGIPLDAVSVLAIIRTCSNSMLASLRHAKFVHGVVVMTSLDKYLMVETALIDLYVKRGSLVDARKVFDRMKERNLVSWSTMISGYGLHGHGKDALQLFESMKCLLIPDHIVFVSVLSACSHAGLVDDGWRCFNSMASEFGIAPQTEHYACMVDLLGRAGKLNEAREFIEKMPIKPDSSVWGSLLGACRIHPNAEIAELAANQLFELDPRNSGRYILLSNIYTSLGKIEEAHRIRALMKSRGVKKTAGYTVIEVRNKVYKFLVGDKRNPQSDLIYRELERLMDRIRREGYVPNTNFALHDVEEEAKEQSLYVHGEKLAIVFGLMNSGPGCVIRIHKNLRVCGDCHSATKFISKVTGREIVVRDSHRFHHFRGGVCSCGDYW